MTILNQFSLKAKLFSLKISNLMEKIAKQDYDYNKYSAICCFVYLKKYEYDHIL